MRKFSDFEKKALKIIANTNNAGYDKQNFEALMNDLFKELKVGVQVKVIDNIIRLQTIYDADNSIKNINSANEQLVSIQLLFEYLESLFLIRFYNDSSLKGKPIRLEEEDTYQKEINDKNIYEFYFEHWTHRFYVTEALRTFVLVNNFETDEQIRFDKQKTNNQEEFKLQIDESKKQTKYARRAFYISFLALLVAIIIPLFSNTKLNKEQLLDIKQSIEALKINIPTKINTVLTNDTLRVDVVKFSPQQLIIKKND